MVGQNCLVEFHSKALVETLANRTVELPKFQRQNCESERLLRQSQRPELLAPQFGAKVAEDGRQGWVADPVRHFIGVLGKVVELALVRMLNPMDVFTSVRL